MPKAPHSTFARTRPFRVAAVGLAALVTVLAASVVSLPTVQANGCSYGGGDGTTLDPFRIETPAHVECLRSHDYEWDMAFVQTADIVFLDVTWDDTPIGSVDKPFEGMYDGSGHSISGLTISTLDVQNVGLFGQVGSVADDTAVVKNLGFTGNVTGLGPGVERSVGGLVGVNYGTVVKSYASGNVTGPEVTNEDKSVGGLVGINHGTVERSYATGEATGGREVGGLVGRNSGTGTVSESFATGNVEGAIFAGALIGYNLGAVVNSFSRGDADADDSVYVGFAGGLIGEMTEPAPNVAFVDFSYATGTASGLQFGGLVGNLIASVELVRNSFRTGASSLDTGESGTLVAVSQMRKIQMFRDAGWDITSGWSSSSRWGMCSTANDGFPFLNFAYASNPCPVPPPPSLPPSAPLQVSGIAADASATIQWTAPTSSGTSPITLYEAVVTPGGQQCVVAAAPMTCTVSGLTNGVNYTATVRAANSSGWGPASSASAAFTPRATPTVTITGTRGVVRGHDGIIVTGTTTLDGGAILRPWVRFPGQSSFTQGVTSIRVGQDGAFVWQRRTGKRIHVIVRTQDGSLASNSIVIKAP